MGVMGPEAERAFPPRAHFTWLGTPVQNLMALSKPRGLPLDVLAVFTWPGHGMEFPAVLRQTFASTMRAGSRDNGDKSAEVGACLLSRKRRIPLHSLTFMPSIPLDVLDQGK